MALGPQNFALAAYSYPDLWDTEKYKAHVAINYKTYIPNLVEINWFGSSNGGGTDNKKTDTQAAGWSRRNASIPHTQKRLENKQ